MNTTHEKAKFLFNIINKELLKNKSILFIDEEAEIESLSHHYLLHYPIRKHQILFAINEQDALAQIHNETHNIGIIFIDVLTPKSNELQFFKEIKLRAKYKDIPVVFVSRNSESENMQKIIILGIKDIFIKPFTCHHFIEKVAKLLSFKSPL